MLKQLASNIGIRDVVDSPASLIASVPFLDRVLHTMAPLVGIETFVLDLNFCSVIKVT